MRSPFQTCVRSSLQCLAVQILDEGEDEEADNGDSDGVGDADNASTAKSPARGAKRRKK